MHQHFAIVSSTIPDLYNPFSFVLYMSNKTKLLRLLWFADIQLSSSRSPSSIFNELQLRQLSILQTLGSITIANDTATAAPRERPPIK